MEKLLSLVLVLGLTSRAGAALTLVNAPTEPIKIGQTSEVIVHSTTGGNYTGWLQITDPTIATFAGEPQFTSTGDPSGNSKLKDWSQSGAWYEFNVVGLSPDAAIAPGDHLLVNIIGLRKGSTRLNLYTDDGVRLWESASISVIPEPATIALLGLGGLFLCRRR